MIQLLAGISLTVAVFVLWQLHAKHKNAEVAREVIEARFLTFMDNTPVVAYMKDQDGRYVYGNKPLERLFGASFEAIRGTTAADWLPPEVADYVRQAELSVLANGRRSEILEDVPAPDGGRNSWLVMKFPFREPTGRLLIGGVAVNISEQVSLKRRLVEQLEISERLNDDLSEANARLVEMASTDGLTGLLNARHFRDVLSSQISFSQRQGKPVSLMMIDVDHFKSFNDTYGHQEGNEALVEVARILRGNARDYDLVARYGGEEFAVLLPETNTDTAMRVAERLRAAIAKHEWPLRGITVSIGLATIDSVPETVQGLLKEADVNLYLAKHHGRNCVVRKESQVPLSCPNHESEADRMELLSLIDNV